MGTNQVYPNASVSLRAPVTDFQAEKLQEGLTRAGLAVMYGEEQHGPTLVVHIQCSPLQEGSVRKLMGDLGVLVLGEDMDHI
jgi:hypothetical protein